MVWGGDWRYSQTWQLLIWSSTYSIKVNFLKSSKNAGFLQNDNPAYPALKPKSFHILCSQKQNQNFEKNFIWFYLTSFGAEFSVKNYPVASCVLFLHKNFCNVQHVHDFFFLLLKTFFKYFKLFFQVFSLFVNNIGWVLFFIVSFLHTVHCFGDKILLIKKV